MATTGEHRPGISRHLRTVFESGSLGSVPDDILLHRYRAGRGDEDSAAAFAALAERHSPMVLSVCRHATGHAEDAEDAAQATFLVLAKRAGSIRRADSLASWLFGVAIRLARKSRARSARRRAIEREVAETRPPAAGPVPSESHAELYDAIDRLPERLRSPVVLCHLEGLTNEQAAARLGLPVRTVQRRLSEGRERLRERLAGLALAPAGGAVSAAWMDATIRAAAGLAAAKSVGTVASASVADLAEGGMAMLRLARMKAVALGMICAGGLAALVGYGASLAGGVPGRQPAAASDQGPRKAPPPVRLGPWIRGIVVDEQGRPIAGARVSSLWAYQPRAVTTGADGAFALPTDEPRLANQSILATAEGGALQGIFRFYGPSGYVGPRTVPRIVLRRAQELSVSVRDGAGAPVPEAAVTVLDLVFPLAQGKTDAEGRATFRVPVEAWTQWILAAKPGVGFDYFENYRTQWMPPSSPPPKSVQLVLNGARTVRVRVVDSAGRPVPGVELYPQRLRKKGKLRGVNAAPLPIDPRTGADGVATFDWLPDDMQEPMDLMAASTSHTLAAWPIFDPARPDAELTATVLRSTRIAGKVVRPDGSPAPGILVLAEGIEGGQTMAGSGLAGAGLARTGADGSYAMLVPPEQSYSIGVIDDEWAARSIGGVVVREGVEKTGLDLALERGEIVWGRVTAGAAAHPSAGQPVILSEKGPGVPPGLFKDQRAGLVHWFQRIADTDEDGRYAFRVGPGTYELSGPRTGGEPPEPIRLTIAEGREVLHDFHLPRERNPFKSVRGVVRAGSADGPPIPDAVLVVEPIEARVPPAQGSADERGRFAFPRMDGKLLVYARSPAGDLAGHALIETDDESAVNLVARPATTGRGRVVDRDGRPWASIPIVYWTDVGLPAVGREGPPGAVQSVTTDADGRFIAPGLPIGHRCVFRAYSPTGRENTVVRMDIRDGRPVEVPPLVLERPSKGRPR